MSPSIEFRSPRLLLRPLGEGDRAEFVRMRRMSRSLHDPWFPSRPADETEDAFFEQQLARAKRGLADETEYRLVALREGGHLAAVVSLLQVVRGAAYSAMASWYVNADVQRQGYTTEAVQALLGFAFAPQPMGLGLHRVQANIIPTNTASIRVAEKNRFRREGLALRYLQIGGEWQDHILFAKLVDEHGTRTA